MEDRISGLPDSILCHILSFLPTKYAVATSILSSRWKLVWTLLPSFSFDDRLCLEYERSGYLSHDSLPMFENFVNRVLALSHPVNINKFSIHCSDPRNLECLNFWISTAVMRNVREIEISVEYEYANVELPESIYTCKTLEVLKLNLDFSVKIPLPGICFPRVKILHVEIYDLEDNSLEILCSNCPALEDLSIIGHLYVDLATFNISSPTLKRLTLAFERKEELTATDHHVLITAPNLEHLCISGCSTVSYTVQKPHSLIKLVVDYRSWIYCNRMAQCLVQLLKDITNARFLSLSKGTILALGMAGVDFFPTLPNLTCLEVELVPFAWRLLPIILSSTPNLESLVLGECIGGEYGRTRTECDFCQAHSGSGSWFQYGWTESLFVPDCLLSHVKTIEIRRFDGEKNQLKLIMYLLKNGEVLNTLIIRFQKLDFNLKDKVYQELLTFERGSNTCKVKVL